MACLAALGLSASALAAPPEITSFHGNGELTWTHDAGLHAFTVRWASSPAGPWLSDWHGLDSVPSTGTQTTVSVPMFYRVSEGFSTASLRGVWIIC